MRTPWRAKRELAVEFSGNGQMCTDRSQRGELVRRFQCEPEDHMPAVGITDREYLGDILPGDA